MRGLRVMTLLLALWACCAGVLFTAGAAQAEGFALKEWSARGVALGGALVGRADDVSALAYNAAGITQLEGTHVMLGSAFIAPIGSVNVDFKDGSSSTTTTKPAVWPVPHGYLSYQANDSLWLGLGVFTRFGLGNSYDGHWTGRYNLYDVGVQTFSIVPTLAYKINEMVSVSLGLEVMQATMYMGTKIPTVTGNPMAPATLKKFDNDMQMHGTGWGVGGHLGLHMRFNDQWSAGLSYKSQVRLDLTGDVEFGNHDPNLLRAMGAKLPKPQDCDAHTTLLLPDSLAVGVAYKPLDNLSFELGAQWTRWSTYNALDIYMDNDYASLSPKKWRDGWNFNAGVEYKPYDWWALRAGFAYETSVVDEKHVDYFVPSSGRSILSLGAGFQWENWTVDLAYSHLWINPVNYDKTDSVGIATGPANIAGGESERVSANIYMFSVGYSF